MSPFHPNGADRNGYCERPLRVGTGHRRHASGGFLCLIFPRLAYRASINTTTASSAQALPKSINAIQASAKRRRVTYLERTDPTTSRRASRAKGPDANYRRRPGLRG
jgi:hypothetical protein